MDLAEKVLAQMQAGNVKPRSRWYFLLRRLALVLALLFMIFLGSFTGSLVLFVLRLESADMGRGMGFFTLASDFLPLLLGTTVLASVACGFWIYRRTRGGYRAKGWRLAGALLIAVVAGSVFFYATSAVFYGHRFLMRHGDSYRALMLGYRSGLWNQPEHGRLHGVVESLEWDGFVLRDVQGHYWRIDDVDARWRIPETRRIGDTVRVLGALRADSLFDALVVLPWRSPAQGGLHAGPGLKFRRDE